MVHKYNYLIHYIHIKKSVKYRKRRYLKITRSYKICTMLKYSTLFPLNKKRQQSNNIKVNLKSLILLVLKHLYCIFNHNTININKYTDLNILIITKVI